MAEAKDTFKMDAARIAYHSNSAEDGSSFSPDLVEAVYRNSPELASVHRKSLDSLTTTFKASLGVVGAGVVSAVFLTAVTAGMGAAIAGAGIVGMIYSGVKKSYELDGVQREISNGPAPIKPEPQNPAI